MNFSDMWFKFVDANGAADPIFSTVFIIIALACLVHILITLMWRFMDDRGFIIHSRINIHDQSFKKGHEKKWYKGDGFDHDSNTDETIPYKFPFTDKELVFSDFILLNIIIAIVSFIISATWVFIWPIVFLICAAHALRFMRRSQKNVIKALSVLHSHDEDGSVIPEKVEEARWI